ncbi:MAG: hypothetical protein IKA46_04205 [Clostridia bacterium]|nr:hypothetical protein [Clostridia bacterium]
MKEKNLKQKIDLWLWALIWILPVLGYVVSFWRAGNAVPIFEYINTNFSFELIRNLLDQIWLKAFDSQLVLSGYISYLIVVEVVHCVFDAIVFIPRFAHALIDKFTSFAGGN